MGSGWGRTNLSALPPSSLPRLARARHNRGRARPSPAARARFSPFPSRPPHPQPRRARRCGAEFDLTPFHKRVEAGADPAAAWAEVREAVEGKARYGTWLRDTFFTGPDDSGRWCHIKEIRGTLQEVDSLVARVRMFQHKPDGEVTLRFSQDANGMPAPVQQDPLHYPHGTAFLAPGPLGQCHPVPGEPGLRAAMAAAADNHQRIHDAYNLPYDPEPGSDMDKAQKLWRRRQARRQRVLDKKLQREAQKIRRMEGAAAAAAAGAPGAGAKPPPPGAEPPADEGSDFDDDDLIASAEGAAAGTGAGRGAALPPGSMFASVSLGLGRAAAALQAAAHAAAIRAPPRRSLTRPQRRQ